jgi:hypothetical protein
MSDCTGIGFGKSRKLAVLYQDFHSVLFGVGRLLWREHVLGLVIFEHAACPDVLTDLFWIPASKEDVRQNLAGIGYPMSRVHLIEGRVEDTIPAHAPRQIALLRLDTDWYDSTRHELIHLYPRLAAGRISGPEPAACFPKQDRRRRTVRNQALSGS